MQLVKVRDGDTVEVRIAGSAFVWAIRLIDCWAPETRGPEKPYGEQAKRHAEEVVAGRELFLHVPLPHGNNLFSNLSFDRIPGYVWIDKKMTLNRRMVEDGYANPKKADHLPPAFWSFGR